MSKYLTFGELMLRLKSPGRERFLQSPSLEATFGGGEANVAVSLANYGLEAEFLSVIPDNAIGDAAIGELRRFNVDTSKVIRTAGRMGIYYLETGANQRASKVIYDRAYSAISLFAPEGYDWDKVYEGVKWLHISGITPAISEETKDASLLAVKEAKKRGVTVSIDLNYRKNLWKYGVDAKEVMTEMTKYADIIIANEEDCQKSLGLKCESNIEGGKLNQEGYLSVARQLSGRFGCKKIAFTLRTSLSASDNDWAGMLYDAEKDTSCFSPSYHIHIVDRVGGGDSFGGGLIYALMNGYDDQAAINFAVAASCLKHSIEHDFNLMSTSEVASLAGGNASGRGHPYGRLCGSPRAEDSRAPGDSRRELRR